MDNQYNYYNPDETQNTYSSNNAGFSNQAPPNNTKSKQKKKWKMPKTLAVVCLALVFGVVSSVTFLGFSFVGNKVLGLTGNFSSGSSSKASQTATLQQTKSSVSSDIADIAANAMPSVVSITNMSVQQVQNFFGQSGEQEVESTGSGIIIGQNDSELLVVTNNHVVEGSETITVSFVDESSVEANIKGTDASLDVAVVAVPLKSISADTMDAISVATLGDSTALKVGEPAIAIGNALGYGQSVTTGIISATDRVLTDSGSDTAFIQTDAAINPGNSGGALLNANGEVIGINSAKLSDTTVEGMGYAIPISDVSDVLTNLMNQETKTKVSDAEKGYIGIQGVDVTSDSAERYNMPEGVYVSSLIKGGGAESAGLQEGDIITGLNGTTIDNMTTLQNELSYYTQGTTVTVTIQRQNGNAYEAQDIQVKLGAQSNN
ncbi:MAG: trypsin-like peptidase domain-containing protein [Hespellia sp.]|nr:trypsin-like peptidase domain-containing protein [Hespellia sp.]